MRGRIHPQNDVINGISGMEHISNSLNAQRANPAQGSSPAILANMRSGPGAYNHHSSVPEHVLMEQLKGVQMHTSGTPHMATAPTKAPLKSSQSRGNLPLMPELEYDPWYTNQ